MSVAEDHGLSQSHNQIDALAIFILSLRSISEEDSKEVYDYVDNCALRLVKKPVEYQELLTSLQQHSYLGSVDQSSLDGIELILITLVEQWPFLCQNNPPQAAYQVARWLDYYMSLLAQTGCNKRVLSLITEQFRIAQNDYQYLGEQMSKVLEQESVPGPLHLLAPAKNGRAKMAAV